MCKCDLAPEVRIWLECYRGQTNGGMRDPSRLKTDTDKIAERPIQMQRDWERAQQEAKPSAMPKRGRPLKSDG